MSTTLSALEVIDGATLINDCFKAFDLDSSGKVSLSELKSVFQTLDRHSWSDDKIERLLQAFDRNNDGEISFHEFVTWTCASKTNEEELNAVVHKQIVAISRAILARDSTIFKSFDLDNDRKVTHAELTRVLEYLTPSIFSKSESRQLVNAFDGSDRNHDGSLSFLEFVTLMCYWRVDPQIKHHLEKDITGEIERIVAEESAVAREMQKEAERQQAEKRRLKAMEEEEAQRRATAAAEEQLLRDQVVRERRELLDNHLEQSSRLATYLTSAASSTESKGSSDSTFDTVEIVPLTEADVRKALKDLVPGISSMLDRTGSTPVVEYIAKSYQNGLPVYNDNPAVQQHTIRALRYIFNCAITGVPGGTHALKRLAEAYQACQAEQGRTIDDLYGKLIGRDATTKDQVLALLDSYKFLTLEAVVHKLNPGAAGMSDSEPSKQATHIFSAYLETVGTELGVRGVSAAMIDRNRPKSLQRAPILKGFQALFSVEEFLDSLVADVNQQLRDAEHVVNLDLLAKWAADASEASGGAFDAYSLYYDEDRAAEYEGMPVVGNEYLPFINRRIAIQILTMLFL